MSGYAPESPTSGVATVTANQGTAAALAGAWPVKVTDGTDLALVTAAGEQNVLATAQPGVDIGDVTVNNAAGAAAVNVQDGGNSITVDGSVSISGTPTIVGNVANDAVDSGNPVGLGAQARTTNPTAVADADRVTLKADKLGRLVVVPFNVRNLTTQNNITLTSTTETTLLAAGAAGEFHDLTTLILSNTSATGVRVDLRDATAGTIRFSVFLAASGGGAVITLSNAVNQTTAANNWTAQLSAAVTDVRIFAQAVKNL